MRHLTLHIGKQVQKTGQFFTLFLLHNFLGKTCGPDLSPRAAGAEVASKNLNENLRQSIRPKSEFFGT
jgi:hypothetical protein